MRRETSRTVPYHPYFSLRRHLRSRHLTFGGMIGTLPSPTGRMEAQGSYGGRDAGAYSFYYVLRGGEGDMTRGEAGGLLP